MVHLIQISNINKSFKKKRVLKNISFDIEKGTCTALIGKNGAGKSTLVDILSNKIIADDGVILDKDKLLQSENRSIMFQKTMFPDQLKVIEIIKLYQSFYENPLTLDVIIELTKFNSNQLKVIEIIKLYQSFYENPLTLDVIIELTKFNSNQLNQFANKLSGGQQRLLDFVISLIGQPQLILLDEPTSNMDIEMREYFWSIIAKLKEENRTILYTSHYIEEVERMSDKIILIENGEIKLNDSTSHIRTNQQSQITLSDEYKRKLKPDKDDLVIQKNHNGTIKIITSNVNDTILYLQQLHINLDDIEIQKVSIVDSYFNNKKQRGSNYDTKLLENRI
ncbi:TPA: ABC transporter ATP-binding protein [Staphylococcus aureus]|nr:ABC transporter ATP-binding protein [Staphylococcus aureus]